jgi:hypothetical protein
VEETNTDSEVRFHDKLTAIKSVLIQTSLNPASVLIIIIYKM